MKENISLSYFSCTRIVNVGFRLSDDIQYDIDEGLCRDIKLGIPMVVFPHCLTYIAAPDSPV